MVKELFINDGRSELYDIIQRITDNLQEIRYINRDAIEQVLSTLEENVLSNIYSEATEYLEGFKSMIATDVLKPIGVNMETGGLSVYFLDNIIGSLCAVNDMDIETTKELDIMINSDSTPTDKLYQLTELTNVVSMTEFYETIDVSPVIMQHLDQEVRNKLDVQVVYNEEVFRKLMVIVNGHMGFATTVLFKHVMDGRADTLYNVHDEEDIEFVEEELLERVAYIKMVSGSVDAIIDEITLTHLLYSDLPRLELVSKDKIGKYFELGVDLEDITLRIQIKLQNAGVTNE